MRAAESPVAAVRRALDAGATTRNAVSERTGLREELASAVIDHLLRTGRLGAQPLRLGCPPAGCRACHFGSDGEAACELWRG